MASAQIADKIQTITVLNTKSNLSILSGSSKEKKTCPDCKKQITQKGFERHLETHLPYSERKKFTCLNNQCSKLFTSLKARNDHVRNFHSAIPRVKFKCEYDQCSKEYLNQLDLKYHVQKVHLGTFSGFECSICEASYSSKQARQWHVVSAHTGEKAYPCEKCPSRFSSSLLLRVHQTVHTEDRPHKCHICLKMFKRSQNLKRHMNAVHLRKNVFRCGSCSKTFFCKDILRQHGRVHNKHNRMEGAFPCYFCKKQFNDRAGLCGHLRGHTLEKPYICGVEGCEHSAVHRNTISHHRKFHHSPAGTIIKPRKIFSCYFCHRTFNKSEGLQTHIRLHTMEEPFPCPLCPRSFKSYPGQQQHIFYHTTEKPFSCTPCEKGFTHAIFLKLHCQTRTHEKRRLEMGQP